ncbi:MAG: hypothetical protein JW969_06195 [Spirochaetales bacterium]|nr:hypothetical protein [Spirochaetales bacterium]
MLPKTKSRFILILLLAFPYYSVYSGNGPGLPSSGLPVTGDSDYFGIGIYANIWYVFEQAENGKIQPLTGDAAVDEASGFSLNKARFYLEGRLGGLDGRIAAKLEGGTPALLDCYLGYTFISDFLRVSAGQMKIPSTYEVEQGDMERDFASMSGLSTVITDWSLCRSVSSVSPFTNTNAYQRDIGFAVNGTSPVFNYLLMLGNGFGANNGIGGNEKKGTVFANAIGDYFYGVRLSCDAVHLFGFVDSFVTSLVPGGHFNYNIHNNILYNDGNTVLDIRRASWSLDLRMELMDRIRFTGMYGQGTVDDDFDNNGETDYSYQGWEAKVMANIITGILETGFRYDGYRYENSIFGGYEILHNFTVGVNYFPVPNLKITGNYKWKLLGGELNGDIDDNIFVISVQGSWEFKF